MGYYAHQTKKVFTDSFNARVKTQPIRYLKCGEEIYSSTEGDVLFPIQKVLLNEIFPSNQIAHVKKQKLIMGTRAQAFTAKIKNLQEIQVRLMQGSLPLPQGHEIANSLKYFR